MVATDVELCNLALQRMGHRQNIRSLTEGNEEAENCRLLYNQTRDQVLAMANWSFARKTFLLYLIKARPGTTESYLESATQWISTIPAPPWLYAYRYPGDCVQFRYLTSQQYGSVLQDAGTPSERFVIGSELLGPVALISGVSKANPAVVSATAHGFVNGESVLIYSVVGMEELNGIIHTIGGVTTNTFTLVGVNSTNYTTYSESGIAINRTQAAVQQPAILTNAPKAIGTYIARIENLAQWDTLATQALISAMAGFLAMPLAQDRFLSRDLLKEANSYILTARVADANEGITVIDWTPDWIAAREGVADNVPGLNASYAPLFAVS